MNTQISRLRVTIFLGFLLILAVLLSSSVIHAQTNPVVGWEEAEVATFDDWLTAFGVPPAVGGDEVAQVNKTFSVADGESTFVLDVMPAAAARGVQPSIEALYGVHISGSVTLKSGRSLVRVILVDAASKEHLVYEAYPLIVTNPSFPLTRVCEETCFLEALQGASIRIELIDAAITLSEVVNLTAPLPLPSTVAAAQQQIKQAQNAVRIGQIQQQIKDKGLKWAAGETPIASLPFDEKRKFFGIPADLLSAPPGEDSPPGIDTIIRNLQGAEYYKGGVFEFDVKRQGPTSPIAPQPNSLIESFDWRERHGANNPDSPYYDGDPDGSGWMTSVKNQGGCGSCWAFAPTAATEALANLYFNQHLDLDLAEQDALSCSGGGSCRGGYPGQALDYMTIVGVVDEACFPYTASDQPCANKCANPSEIIKITGREPFGFFSRTEEQLKRWIIERGPPSAGIYSWGHTMALVGYEKDPDDGETIWIFKNSWGRNWGEKGYLRIKVSLSDMGWTHSLLTPVVSSTQDEISCVDHDGDGFYNWGISEAKPPNCPANAAPEKDCDDSNARRGPFESNGNCSVIGSNVVNEQLALTQLTTAFSSSPCGGASAGTFTIIATFTNTSADTLIDLLIAVQTLTGGNVLCNAAGGPGGARATITVPFKGNLADGQLAPGESFVVELPVGLQSLNPFTFVVDVLGEGVRACPCVGLRDGETVWDDSYATLSCTHRIRVGPGFEGGQSFTLESSVATVESLGTGQPFFGDGSCGAGQASRGIQGGGFEACSQSLRQIAANDGVACIFEGPY